MLWTHPRPLRGGELCLLRTLQIPLLGGVKGWVGSWGGKTFKDLTRIVNLNLRVAGRVTPCAPESLQAQMARTE